MTTDPTFADGAAIMTVIGYCNILRAHLPEAWTRFMPLAAVAMGILYALVYRPGCTGRPECLVAGFAIGISASGVYSGGKSLAQKPAPPT